jgi:hypothetical protein
MTPLRWLYAVLGAITLAAVGFYHYRGSLGAWSADWMPNVGTSALTILATVAVVDQIIKRREEERLRPRVEAATDEVTWALHSVVASIAADYIETHVSNYEEVPSDLREIIEFWRAHRELEDAQRFVHENGETHIIRAAHLSSERLRAIRDAEHTVLEPVLVVALGDFAESLGLVDFIFNLSHKLLPQQEQAERQRIAASLVVDAAEAFLNVYTEQPQAELELGDFEKSTLRGARIMARSGRWQVATDDE